MNIAKIIEQQKYERNIKALKLTKKDKLDMIKYSTSIYHKLAGTWALVSKNSAVELISIDKTLGIESAGFTAYIWTLDIDFASEPDKTKYKKYLKTNKLK